MNQELETEDLLRQYLLGNLPADVMERVEKQLMTGDTKFLERFAEAEQDLADEYADGLLRNSEKESFESVFLAHPERRRLVAFAHALRRYIDASPASGTQARPASPSWLGRLDFLLGRIPGFRVALAASFLVIVAVGAILVHQVHSLHQSLDRALAQQSASSTEREKLAGDLRQEQQRRQQLEQEMSAIRGAGAGAEASGSQPGTGVIAITLLPGMVREAGGSAQIPRIVFPPGGNVVRVKLVLDGALYPSYNLLLQTPEGKQVWMRTGLHAGKIAGENAIVIQLTRNELESPQDYLLKLSGVNPDGTSESARTYYFRVAER
jgi:hypothetical protein